MPASRRGHRTRRARGGFVHAGQHARVAEAFDRSTVAAEGGDVACDLLVRERLRRVVAATAATTTPTRVASTVVDLLSCARRERPILRTSYSPGLGRQHPPVTLRWPRPSNERGRTTCERGSRRTGPIRSSCCRKSVPIPANNHKTITKPVHDANFRTYQDPPKAASVVASIARQSSSRSTCSTSAMARTVCGTR